jgi:hypothetical protein
MADTHYEVDETLYHARKLLDPVRKLRTNFSELEDVFAVMNTMKDGDGSQASHFQSVVDLYGVKGIDANDKLVAAKAIYDELNSTVNGSGKDALLQLLARLG